MNFILLIYIINKYAQKKIQDLRGERQIGFGPRGKLIPEVVYDFLLKTLIEFTNETTFKFDWEGFLKMYYHNVDIWGTLMCLLPLLEQKFRIDEKGKIKKKVADILMKYCYLNPTEAINIDNLNKDLNELIENKQGGKKTKNKEKKEKKENN